MAKIVMVVDDDPDIHHLLDRTLSRRGYLVVNYSSAREAISAIERGDDYDLILIDSCLRTSVTNDFIDGRAVAEVSKGINPSIPRVNMSGKGEETNREREFYNRFIGKPFSMSELTDLVSSCIGE